VSQARPRVGVVGHVEWVDFAPVERVPVPGEIVHARGAFAAPAGGGAVAAVQLRKLAGTATFLTALGDDDLGSRAQAQLSGEHALDLHVAWRSAPQRRAFTLLDATAERTIVVLGERLVPHGSDDLPWPVLADLDGVYFTGGDVKALRASRAAKVLVATPRALPTLVEAGVELDVLVASAKDPGETYAPGTLDPEPRVVALTHGASGGEWVGVDGRTGAWAAAELPGPAVDAYGCGDSFAAGLTYALAAGESLDGALALGSRCGAACMTGRGPYAGQLEST
jgi:ribokinase